MNSSEFFLERVGLEGNVSLRKNLNTGENLIGRRDVVGVDIGIDSALCSRKHCIITVSDSSVEIEDLKVRFYFLWYMKHLYFYLLVVDIKRHYHQWRTNKR